MSRRLVCFATFTFSQILAEDWRIDYNREHPHSALGYRSPGRVRDRVERPGDLTPAATRRGREPYRASRYYPHAVD